MSRRTHVAYPHRARPHCPGRRNWRSRSGRAPAAPAWATSAPPPSRCCCWSSARHRRRSGACGSRSSSSIVGDAGVQLLLSSACRDIHDCRSAELGRALRVSDRRGHCQQPVGGSAERAREAVARRNEVTRLFDLTRDVLLTTETTGGLDASRATSHGGSSSRAWRSACRRITGGAVPGGADGSSIRAGVLDTALAQRAGRSSSMRTQRAYGGHMHVGPGGRVVAGAAAARDEDRSVCWPPRRRRSISARSTRLPASWRSRSSGRSSWTSAKPRSSCARRRTSPSTLLASLSHDLRTPLTAIRVAVENLRGDLPADERRDAGGAPRSRSSIA